ncbi:MAG: tetratricopeptide repeat protein [Bacteroidales bacterium]|nr:tetratricopeptide repeat protein [Bacteroidales bacterium]
MKRRNTIPAAGIKPLILVIGLFMGHVHSQAQEHEAITVLMQKYEYQEVLEQIDRIEKPGVDLSLLRVKAAALKGLNRYQEAIQVVDQVYKSDSTDLRIIIELANCYQSLGDYKQAQQFFQKAIRIKPENRYLYQQLADAYYFDDDFVRAIEIYSGLYAGDSTYYLSKQLALSYDNLHQDDPAIYYYRKAIALNPVELLTSFNLAGLLQLKEDYAGALLVTESYLKHDSTNLRMLQLNGYLNFLHATYPRAVSSFEKCISLKDTSDFTVKYLGYSYYRAEEYEKAKDYLEKAFLKDTTNIQLCYALGLSCDYSVYKKLGIGYLNKTIELSTPPPEFLSRVYQDLAAANTGYYKYDAALAAYFKARELTPNDTLLKYRIASHYDNWIKDKKKALEYYRIFMATRPKNRKPLPKDPTPEGIVLSYYDVAEKRIREIEEELFFEGEGN